MLSGTLQSKEGAHYRYYYRTSNKSNYSKGAIKNGILHHGRILPKVVLFGRNEIPYQGIIHGQNDYDKSKLNGSCDDMNYFLLLDTHMKCDKCKINFCFL